MFSNNSCNKSIWTVITIVIISPYLQISWVNLNEEEMFDLLEQKTFNFQINCIRNQLNFLS